jgi:broad specificity phosphatase PhoE
MGRSESCLPSEIVFIRHGESESNVVYSNYQSADSISNIEKLYNKPNRGHLLSPVGIEQVKTTKLWLEKEMGGLAVFNALYVSPYLRAIETARYLCDEGDIVWNIDDRIAEREWGEYIQSPLYDIGETYPVIKKKLEKSWFWTRPPGGENIPDVNNRFDSFLNTLSQKNIGQKVLAVTHGGFMRVVRYNLEQMLPEEYESSMVDSQQDIRNCSVLCYSRVNPVDSCDVRSDMTWRRLVYPCNESESPDGGNWVKFNKTYTNEDWHS